MSDDDVVVTGLAALTPVGNTAPTTCAALRARISRIGELEAFMPRTTSVEAPAPAQVARVAALDQAPSLARGHALAVAVFHELVVSAGLQRALLPAVHVCLAGPLAGARWARELGLGGVSSIASTTGHAGGLAALLAGAAALRRKEARVCVVIGAESHLDGTVLTRLDEQRRLRSPRNRDGFVPGEAAAACALELREHARRRGRPILARVAEGGHGLEPHTNGGSRVSSGEGLSAAVRTALAHSSGPLWTVGDLNGESYRAHEWALVRTRLGAAVEPMRGLWHPADCVGDIGAASGPLYVNMVCRAFQRSYAPAARALLWCADDGAARVACVLTAA